MNFIAPAKINLSLRLLGKREDGYHEIETLMAPLALADEIELLHTHGHAPGNITFFCNDPSLPTGDDNLCIKAAKAFQEASGLLDPITITLLKKIPHGAGLGGGSSDAATILRGMNALFEEPLCFEELHQLATSLGSDVPFFLDPKPRWCRGRGELLGETISLPHWKLLLIKPPFPIASAEAYSMLEAQSRLEAKPTNLDSIAIFNDLEPPIFKKYLQLPMLKSWLKQQSEVATAWMTGSGSTMVAALKGDISKEKISALQKRIAVEFGPYFWVKETYFA